jgi:hypothetical protein
MFCAMTGERVFRRYQWRQEYQFEEFKIFFKKIFLPPLISPEYSFRRYQWSQEYLF